MYGVVFKRSPKGNIIVTKRPDMSKVKWSKAQKAQRQRFKQAVASAKAALAEPKVRPVMKQGGEQCEGSICNQKHKLILHALRGQTLSARGAGTAPIR